MFTLLHLLLHDLPGSKLHAPYHAPHVLCLDTSQSVHITCKMPPPPPLVFLWVCLLAVVYNVPALLSRSHVLQCPISLLAIPLEFGSSAILSSRTISSVVYRLLGIRLSGAPASASSPALPPLDVEASPAATPIAGSQVCHREPCTRGPSARALLPRIPRPRP